jgi:hypothetical protein
MNKSVKDLASAKTPVFKTGDYVQLTRAQDKHLPIGTTAMVNERFTDGIDPRRDAYFVTFDNDSDIIRVQDLAPADVSQAPLISAKVAETFQPNVKHELPHPPTLKRTVEGENNLFAEPNSKKQKLTTEKA